jgi:hypothetical protein
MIEHDTLFSEINLISLTECNEKIIGFSLGNPGFSCFI